MLKIFSGAKIKILVLLVIPVCVRSQVSNKSFVRIKYDCIAKSVTDVKFFKDSLLMWNFFIDENDTVQKSYKYFYDEHKKELGNYVYRNSKVSKVDSLPKGKDGKVYQRMELGEYDNCQGAECTRDKFGRLIEIKHYRYPDGTAKPKTKVLEDWHKFYYLSNIDYGLMLSGLK